MEISKNRNGSRTVCVFKTHYREPGVGTLEVQPYQLDRDFGRYGVHHSMGVAASTRSIFAAISTGMERRTMRSWYRIEKTGG
jgi:hypothetical protein